jgi:hypothetical protein
LEGRPGRAERRSKNGSARTGFGSNQGAGAAGLEPATPGFGGRGKTR